MDLCPLNLFRDFKNFIESQRVNGVASFLSPVIRLVIDVATNVQLYVYMYKTSTCMTYAALESICQVFCLAQASVNSEYIICTIGYPQLNGSRTVFMGCVFCCAATTTMQISSLEWLSIMLVTIASDATGGTYSLAAARLFFWQHPTYMYIMYQLCVRSHVHSAYLKCLLFITSTLNVHHQCFFF